MFREHAVELILIAALCASISCGRHAEPEIHLIPTGFMGDVFIVHGVTDGQPAHYEGRYRVYSIPASGVLRSETASNCCWWRGGEVQYYYVADDGSRSRIEGFWPSSIHDTPENRADSTLGIWFPRTGTVSLSGSSCKVHLDQYYVGTKTFLLDRQASPEITEYLKENPVACQ
jgi:hypothetical protein